MPSATLRPLPSPLTGLPRLPEPPFRRAVPTCMGLFLSSLSAGAHLFLRQFLCSIWSSFLRSLIATAKASAKLSIWHHFLPSRYFSGLTAPQAFTRLDRRMQTPTRAGHVKAGRSSRPPKAWPLHARARRHAGSIGACFSSSLYFASRSNIRLCRCIVLFAVEGLAAPWPSRVSTPQCPERVHSVAERIARSPRPVPTGTTFRCREAANG